MAKLISLNVEGKKHYDLILPFISQEKPDVLALMEATRETESWLQNQGYQTTYAPITLKSDDGANYEIGLLFASQHLHTAVTHYYHYPNPEGMVLADRNNIYNTVANPVILAKVKELGINVATTHFTWSPQGEVADLNQTTSLKALLTFLKNQSPHILCGDFNIPRFQNSLYDELTKYYTDTIPKDYASSLDRERHRLGNIPTHNNLFKSFMVDYLFTQPPYKASNVRLQFGVSDHAAVLADINIAG
ncbi:MAG: endonuclease/exonuclease/phosphatase family protein [Candidatus Paceibacterota bacterium]